MIGLIKETGGGRWRRRAGVDRCSHSAINSFCHTATTKTDVKYAGAPPEVPRS